MYLVLICVFAVNQNIYIFVCTYAFYYFLLPYLCTTLYLTANSVKSLWVSLPVLPVALFICLSLLVWPFIFIKKSDCDKVKLLLSVNSNEQNVPVFEVILVRILWQKDWTRSISFYSVQMRENVDQNNSKYGHFSCSANRNLSQTIADDFRLSYWYCYASICQSFCLYLWKTCISYRNGIMSNKPHFIGNCGFYRCGEIVK